mmetsp:Transcript_4432/g.8167  ORF Transcript_4432/g.8167 Transcript_4432/m.8167 type:complete len:134 (-) Transcript_4432:276-677(-)
MMKDSDSVADSSSLIASLMEATGSPIENATLALQKCGGNKQKALELLLTGGGANFNDKQQSVSAGASKGAKLDENVEITKASMAQQDTASTAAAARGTGKWCVRVSFDSFPLSNFVGQLLMPSHQRKQNDERF